jgi:hypothetical protein
MFGYDPELPDGFQDADFEMQNLIERGNLIAELKRKGICTHQARKIEGTPTADADAMCTDCGAKGSMDELDQVLQKYI